MCQVQGEGEVLDVADLVVIQIETCQRSAHVKVFNPVQLLITQVDVRETSQKLLVGLFFALTLRVKHTFEYLLSEFFFSGRWAYLRSRKK
jgi:hypothetical protein